MSCTLALVHSSVAGISRKTADISALAVSATLVLTHEDKRG